MKEKIELGDEVKDTITDLKGTVVGITKYLYGCTQCGIQQRELYEGRVNDLAWVDMPQLKLIKKAKKLKQKEKEPPHGGIRSHPR